MLVNLSVPGRAAPFVIWTLQRTGGTNLTQRLIELSGLVGIEHEPFNQGRMHGGVTTGWLNHQDDKSLASDMSTIAARGQVIKHCVENVPWEVSEALARATSAAGYRHLFLYRRQPLGRLLSLQYARVSGVWGPGMKGQREESLSLEDQRLPVPQLVRHEQFCADLLGRAWEVLLSAGAQPYALAFEDLYAAAQRAQAQDVLAKLLAELGVALPASELPVLLDQVTGQGNQGTSAKYQQFQGVEALKAALATGIRPFVPAPALRSCRVEIVEPLANWTRWASVDKLPPIVPARPKIEGVVVVSPQAPAPLSLWLQAVNPAGNGGLVPQSQSVPWSFASHWAAQKFPASPNAKTARFSVQTRLETTALDLLLEHAASGECQRVARVSCAALTNEQVLAAVHGPQPDGWAREVWLRSLAMELARVPEALRDTAWLQARAALSAQTGSA